MWQFDNKEDSIGRAKDHSSVDAASPKKQVVPIMRPDHLRADLENTRKIQFFLLKNNNFPKKIQQLIEEQKTTGLSFVT